MNNEEEALQGGGAPAAPAPPPPPVGSGGSICGRVAARSVSLPMAFTEGQSAQRQLPATAYVGGLARITGGAAKALFVEPGRVRKARSLAPIHQAMAAGVEALPIVSLISFFIGLIFAPRAPISLRKLWALVQFVKCHCSCHRNYTLFELGPLMTAVMVIGCSSSSFAAEIGTMKVNEEIDAMETMALEPVRFLVAPKLLAMMLMMPCLTTWADFMGVVGGGLFGVTSGPVLRGIPISLATL